MAKIGTAHIEIKPVIDDEALERITARVEEAVAAGVARGIRTGASSSLTISGGVTIDPVDIASYMRGD